LATVLLAIAGADASAQARRSTTRRRTNNAASQQVNNNAGNNGNTLINPATGNAVTPPPDTTAPAGGTALSQRPDNIFGFIDSSKSSLRNDHATDDANQLRDRIPLTYQYIRKDDAFWGKRLWEEIDVHEKMNLPFQYAADEDEGSQIFINILLKAIRDTAVVAFDPIDDRFTTPLTIDQLGLLLHGKADSIRVVDPVTGKETVQVVSHDFDPKSVSRYRIKEEWVFDKQTSQLYVRILGIAPLRTIYEADGVTVRAMTPMFWIYYPDLRPVLAKYEVYNPKNFAMRMSWEDLFEMRFFQAYVVKEDNVFDRSIKDYEKDGVRRLLEGQRIKNDIFNFEQGLWQY
jgi:gliding motility associated protien GldN